ALELLLDASQEASVASALITESATYSLLQAGPEHQAWLAGRPRRRKRDDESDPVLFVREGTVLRLRLNRPDVRNAFNAAVRDATFQLPELSMGLVPGAGGTVSIPRRIGRERFAWLALTGEMIDAPTALAWGLVDEVSKGA